MMRASAVRRCPAEHKLLYIFEDYVLDTGRRELRHGNAIVRVQPQVFDLLEFLIRNRDRVVSKDDILDAVWAGRIVSESALTTRINAARAALEDNGEDQRLIRPLHRKGLRFVGAVREEQRPADRAAVAIEGPVPELPATVPEAGWLGGGALGRFGTGEPGSVVASMAVVSGARPDDPAPARRDLAAYDVSGSWNDATASWAVLGAAGTAALIWGAADPWPRRSVNDGTPRTTGPSSACGRRPCIR